MCKPKRVGPPPIVDDIYGSWESEGGVAHTIPDGWWLWHVPCGYEGWVQIAGRPWPGYVALKCPNCPDYEIRRRVERN